MDHNLDLNKKPCLCPVAIATTLKEHFFVPEKTEMPIMIKSQEQSDIGLLGGHAGSNLLFNGQPTESKTWPEIFTYRENYVDFLKRLKNNNKAIYDVYFNKSPLIDEEIIKKIFQNSNKTTYQLSFSPEMFTPRTEKRRFAKIKSRGDLLQNEETTYRTYFRRMRNSEELKERLQEVENHENKRILENDLKKIMRCNRSTYHDELSVLGQIYSKPTPPGPIDRYTLRKI